ncbi:MAG: hypothetical protein ACXQTS_00105 [Candidatus Methanospirareceae archaeon]
MVIERIREKNPDKTIIIILDNWAKKTRRKAKMSNTIDEGGGGVYGVELVVVNHESKGLEEELVRDCYSGLVKPEEEPIR